MKLELDDSYFTLEVTQHAQATFCQHLSPNSVLLTLETIRGKHPDTPQRYVYLGETQSALGNFLLALQFDEHALTVLQLK